MMNSKKLDSSLLVKSLKLDTVLFLVKQYIYLLAYTFIKK